MSALPIDAVLETLREPHTPNLSPSRFAERLHLQMQDLAAMAGVHRNTLQSNPDSARVQAGLRNLARVYAAALQIQPDETRAVFFLSNTPIPTFKFKTALQLVQEGRTDDVIAYLDSIASGFVG